MPLIRSIARLIAPFTGSRPTCTLVMLHRPHGILRVVVRQMPPAAEFTTIYPKFRSPLDEALLRRTKRLYSVVVHDFIGGRATFGSEVVHVPIVRIGLARSERYRGLLRARHQENGI